MSTDYEIPQNEKVYEAPETAQRNNRLIKGEIARLTLFIDTSLDRFRGKGWTEVARVATDCLPFMVTPANVRDLCQSEHLPHFAVIDPKVQEGLLLERLVDLERRVEQHERECSDLRGLLDSLTGRLMSVEHNPRLSWKDSDAAHLPGFDAGAM